LYKKVKEQKLYREAVEQRLYREVAEQSCTGLLRSRDCTVQEVEEQRLYRAVEEPEVVQGCEELLRLCRGRLRIRGFSMARTSYSERLYRCVQMNM
jgi:hypothetical protein